MIKATVSGAAGRMGRAIIGAINSAEGVRLAGALERKGHLNLGQDAGQLAGIGDIGIPLVSEIESLLGETDVFIDFSSPDAALLSVEACVKEGTPAVVGTTGLSPDQVTALTLFSRTIPVVFAPNMSVGVNLLFKLAKEAALSLGDGYDVEIIEAHHRNKKDAPSGTAMHLAEVVAGALGRDLDQTACYSRRGLIGERGMDEIGIQTIRAGDIVGEHTLILAGPGERLELTHRAHNRDNFALGAVRAARWIVNQPPGLHTMADVLGLN